LNFALDEFESYEISSGFQEDGEWNYYSKLLYPAPKEWQIIQNHKVCDQLKAKEDNLHLKRAIEHRAFFGKDGSKREELSEKLKAEGFKIQSKIENEDGVEGFSFYRIDKPFYTDIDELTLGLIDLLEAYGASYDGWETSIAKN
jgi:hypothetical protein